MIGLGANLGSGLLRRCDDLINSTRRLGHRAPQWGRIIGCTDRCLSRGFFLVFDRPFRASQAGGHRSFLLVEGWPRS
jgi:hypothetical protein